MIAQLWRTAWTVAFLAHALLAAGQESPETALPLLLLEPEVDGTI